MPNGGADLRAALSRSSPIAPGALMAASISPLVFELIVEHYCSSRAPRASTAALARHIRNHQLYEENYAWRDQPATLAA